MRFIGYTILALALFLAALAETRQRPGMLDGLRHLFALPTGAAG